MTILYLFFYLIYINEREFENRLTKFNVDRNRKFRMMMDVKLK